MKNNFLNASISNIYTKPNIRSEISSQILYGEKFKILDIKKDWVKIKTYFDKYVGYIKKQKFKEKFRPQFKIYKLKSKIFIKRKNKFLPTKNYLYFASGISVLKKYRNYIEFEKNKWIKKNHTKKIDHHEKNYFRIIKLFLNTKYLWGGKTSNGIDCSGLIQIYFYYNRIYFPRDTKDQIKYCKKKVGKKLIKGDIVFWKGHVGICLDQSNFIHAYGPKKKVIIMPTLKTINLIYKTANLKVKKVSNIKKY